MSSPEENILREVLRRAPAAMVVTWGRDLRFRWINEQAATLMPAGEKLIGRTVGEVFPGAEVGLDELRRRVFDDGETLEVHDVPVSGDRYFTVFAVPIDGPTGGPEGVLTVAHETTVDHQARHGLERDLASEHRIATELQTSLMPGALPRVPGLDIGSGFRPAGDGYEIGGDFYDVFPVRDGCWMVTLGDVCGKGAEAATVTALARYTLRAAAMRDEADPCTVLSRLNDALLHQRGDGRFVSALCVFVQPRDDGGASLEVCVAGHLPPLRVDSSGGVEPIGGDSGTVLGVWDDLELAKEEVDLAQGERLVLYTDGVLDADPSRELTEDGVAELLASEAARGSAADTVRVVEREVVERSPTNARDDIALLVLRAARQESVIGRR